MNTQYCVYILRTSGNTLYIGQTKDITKRLIAHKSKAHGSKYLRMFTSFELVYLTKVESLSKALKLEAKLKNMSRSDKDKLISKKQYIL